MTAIFFVGFVGDFGFRLDSVVDVEFSRHDRFNGVKDSFIMSKIRTSG